MAKDTNTQTSGGDKIAAGSGQTAVNRLDAGRTYTGLIKETFHGDNLYTVLVDKLNTTVQCKWAVGIFAPLVGVRLNYMPPVNTKVVFVANTDGPNWIISCLPSEKYDSVAGPSKTMMGEADGTSPYKPEKGGRGLSTVKPNDLLEGEFELTNTFGAAIHLLTTFARIQGSDRAKVETFLLDDMVRIISDTYKHHSSFGDFQIYNDGRLNCTWNGTSYEHEAWGLDSPTDQKVELDNRKSVFGDTPEDKFINTGRWRFSKYVGFLGNFIHMFVSDPTTTLSNIAENALRAGKARVHINNDGTLLMQSVAEIAIERVCRIAVPAEIRRQDDPEGNKKEDFDKLESSFLRMWDYGENMKSAHHAAYQLRQYARWLSCFHSMARFHQLDKEWDVPKETDAPTPSWFNKEQDVEDVNNGKPDSYDVYATFRIMRDGSIVIWDNYGSAVSMVKGDIQVSSSRHLIFDAAGDIRMTAGQNIYIKARRNIEISAIVGGLVLKARTWWKGFCEWGSIWLKSDAIDPAKDSPPTPDNAEQDPAPEVMAAAVVIEASQGQTLIQSERRTTITAIGTPDAESDITDTTASVVIQSRRQDVRAIAARHSILKVMGLNESKIILDGEMGKSVIIKANKFLVKASLFDVNNKFTFKNSTLHLSELRSQRAHFSTVVSGPVNKGVDIALQPPYNSHGNHLGNFADANAPIELADGNDTSDRDSYSSSSVKEVKPYVDNGDPPDGPDWSYPDNTKAFNNGDSAEEIFQPLAQQRIAFDTPMQVAYDDWTWATDNMLKQGKRTKITSLPFPGTGAKEKVHEGGQPLHTPLNEKYSDQSPDKATDLKDKNVVRKYLKY
jgi:hypothetical protein